jgi:hypothetical protein
MVNESVVGTSDKCLSPVDTSGNASHACEPVEDSCIDPKLVADQLGHGLGVNLDVYTISDLTQRHESVNLLEQSLASSAIN